MNISHKDLILACVECLDTFDPETKALEDHLNKFLKNKRIVGETDQTFITEIFSGCVRYSKVLKVVMDGFFARDGKHVLRSEEHLYRVIAYLALFRLDELGMAHFMRFVKAQDVNRMYKFLGFFINEKNLRTWMKDEWIKLYETTFVQTTLLSPLLRWLPELQDLLKQLKDKIDNKIKPKPKSSAKTEVKPFNITQPRPRSVPMPEPIPKLQPHQPVPNTMYEEPRELEYLAFLREENRRKAEEHLMEASRKQFNCANPDKSEKTKQRLHSIMTEQEAKLDFNKHKSNPVPSNMLSDNIPIKLNAAAILREGKLYQKMEEEELKKLERLEAGARDPSGFLEWQNKMRQQDLDEKIAEIERRRLEGKLSHEEAILARQNLIKDNKVKVAQMKQEAADMMQQYLEKRLKEEEQMRGLVEQVMEGHENAKDAKKKLQEYKAKLVQEVTEESKELMKQALERAEEEMREKMLLIQEIRAMEATPVIRTKLVDQTEVAGHGLLSEMSIVELHERISFLKISQKEEEETKRDEILMSKTAKDQMLMDTLQTISRHRQEQTKAQAQKLEQKKKSRQERPEVKDEKLLELQRRLEEKRAQRLREQESAKIKPDRKSSQRLRQLSAGKKTGEFDRWRELEQTREKTARLVSQGITGSQSAARLAQANRGPLLASGY